MESKSNNRETKKQQKKDNEEWESELREKSTTRTKSKLEKQNYETAKFTLTNHKTDLIYKRTITCFSLADYPSVIINTLCTKRKIKRHYIQRNVTRARARPPNTLYVVSITRNCLWIWYKETFMTHWVSSNKAV